MNIKKLIIGCFMQFAVIAVFAQNISITGQIINEDSVPAVAVNVILFGEDGENVAGVSTGNDGIFAVQNIVPAKNYKLVISHTGYETIAFDFEKPSKDIDLQTVVLLKAVEQIEGASVTATKILADRRLVYPTSKQKELSGDGVTLLHTLKLPRLSVSPGTSSIKYWGRNGNLKLLINDVPATEKQVLALAAADIIYIEYIDNPGAEHTGAGLVLNYVVKRFETGLTGNINATKSLNRNSFDGNIMLKANHKNSEFGVDYTFGTGKDTRRYETMDEYFNYGDTAFLHRYSSPQDVLSKVNNHTVALSYVYSKPKNTLFYIKSQYAYQKVPVDDYISHMYETGINPDTLMQETNRNSNRKQLYNEIYYRKQFNEKHTLSLNVYNTFSRTFQKSTYRTYENASLPDIENIQSDVDGKASQTQAGAVYTSKFNKQHTFYAGLIFTNSSVSNTYYSTESSLAKINNSILTSYATYDGNFDRLFLRIRMRAKMNRVSQSNAAKYTRYEFEPYLYVSYRIIKNMGVRYTLTHTAQRPELSQISNASYVIDDLRMRRGNPLLRTGSSINNTLRWQYSLPVAEINLTLEHSYNPKYISEETILENGKFIQMPFNMRYNHAFYNELEISTGLSEIVSLSYTLGFNRFINKGETYRHYYGKWYHRLNASVNLKGWLLNATVWSHNNDFYGETLFTSGRGILFNLMKSWFDGRLTTALMLYNPFSNYSKQGTVSHSSIAPYAHWLYYNDIHRRLDFSITYRFNYGRKPLTDINTGTTVNSNTGIMHSGKSTENKN